MKAPEAAKIFGENVRRRRQELGLTQTDLGRRIGAPHSQVSDIERGQNCATIATVAKLAEALATSIPDLFQDVRVPA